jgi:hypothetical protein
MPTKRQVPALIDVLSLADDSDMVEALEGRMHAAIAIQPFDYDRLDLAARLCFAPWGLDVDVNNGGFGQYFSNYTGDGAADAPALLRRIGERKIAGLLQLACAIFPNGIAPRSIADRRRSLERMPERHGARLDQLSIRFFLDNWRSSLARLLRASTDELLDDEASTFGIAEGT